MNINAYVSFIKKNVKLFNRNTAHFYQERYLCAWLDEIMCFFRYGASPEDYYRYEFYKKSGYERNKYITYRRGRAIVKRYNDKNSVRVLDDKVSFNQMFQEFLFRDWIDVDSVSEEAFAKFLKKHEVAILKPKRGSGGKGVFIATYKEYKDKRIALSDFRNYIAEEILQQHVDMAILNPTSVNTVRVMTFGGKAISCSCKIGCNNSFVDNMSSGGIYGHVDLKSGILDSLCYDIQLQPYLRHPTTNRVLLGFQIPNWDMVCSTVEDAAAKIPNIGYIGWDVAVLKDRVALVEGNARPGHDLNQQAAQTGLYDIIKKISRDM